MTVVLLGTLSAVLYGVSDFVGGFVSRSQPAIRVTVIVFVASGIVVVPALAVVDAEWSSGAVAAGLVAGILGTISTWLFYAALAIGPVGFVAPTVALITAAIPTTWAIARGEPLTPLTIGGLVVAVIAGLLLSTEPDALRRPSRKVVAFTIITGCADGWYLVVMNASPPKSGAVPLVADLVAGVAFALLIDRIRRRSTAPAESSGTRRRDWALMIGTGVTQGLATTALVFGLHLPQLAVMGALAGLYPLGTVVLALLVLHERLRPVHIAGLALAVSSVAVLSLTHP